ncbi:gamma-mobile-trio recombinase GmtY [Pseudomonas syringae]|uniref:gamma-mobile-trio recombinase GmtY n=1 Tax=Pseudomonas syringae TaxID=317 RepID=UPI000E31664C|nr:gamma-mobile-trio recombinase GmtY [Pseudomonas syringae]
MKTILEASHREYREFVNRTNGGKTILPIIVTDQGVLDQFANYIYLHRQRSGTWQDQSAYSVQLLIEYVEATHHQNITPKELFSEFCTALYAGTISNAVDSSNLWWEARHPESAAKIISHLTHFTDWLSATEEDPEKQLNPWKEARSHEQRLNWAAIAHKRDKAFLSHLWRPANDPRKTRAVSERNLPVERLTPALAFPELDFENFIEKGFIRRTRTSTILVDLKNMLITYLMHFGGLRLSEALSLWTSDVSIESGEIVVRIYHPEYGLAPNGKMRKNYLSSKYGLTPRNKLVKSIDSLFLGWKNCLITDPLRRCFEVFFYPHSSAIKFAQLWRDYHFLQRISPSLDNDHPYAFTNQRGQPYTHRMFRKAHKRAVEITKLTYSKTEGTTPHGHRHAYGQRLASDGAEALLIKYGMHHRSISSSQSYTQPSANQLRQKYRELEEKMREGAADRNNVRSD